MKYNHYQAAERAKLGSRLGFLMLAAGCAVGLGNVWRFPFIVGQNGGAAFVLVYLLFLAVMGFPMLTAELALGRASRQGISGAMRKLAEERYKRFWSIMGCVIFAGNFLLMIYYTDVSGWLLNYSHCYLKGTSTPDFAEMLKDVPSGAGYMALSVAIATLICALGVKNGVERATKWMMLALLALLGVLAAKSLSLPGAAKGLKFYLAPDWSHFVSHPWKVVFDAMGQAFFTLSTGVGCMAIFGSYIDREHSLAKESVWIIAIDTFVAFLSGLVIFPACASFDIDVTSGPGLIFIALPKVFANMSAGRIWGFLFFLFLSLGALTTIIAVFECLIGGLVDELRKPRITVTAMIGLSVVLFSLPTVLFEPVLGWEDFIFGQFWLPSGALMICVFVTRKCGWGAQGFIAEASKGEGIAFPPIAVKAMKYLLPFLIVGTMAIGLCNS
ncbi:MAG: sodium-dependent transporter [Kiritimatiellae bacterium]|nr:sodium-dependent transporter [Kiritimatiellia bacterium]